VRTGTGVESFKVWFARSGRTAAIIDRMAWGVVLIRLGLLTLRWPRRQCGGI
jgi:hypothetical protein